MADVVEEMKFEEHLGRHAIPEWRAKYIDYHALKAHLELMKINYPRARRTTFADVEFFDEAQV